MSGSDIGISGWLKNSFIDYPGTVATVLFFRGCNLRCPYCHNGPLVRKELPEIPFSDVLDFLLKRKGILEGVVLSGGEPTIHATLPLVVREVRKLGYRVKIDSNGLNPDMIETCAPDYLSLDIKTIPERYTALGCSTSEYKSHLQQSLQLVRAMGARAEVRITVAPGFVDEEVIIQLRELLAGISQVFLQPYRNTTDLLDRSFAFCEPLPEREIQHYRDLLALSVGTCSIRGE